jgi:TRAP-type C4-dicarboxylate transport system permease small subunit
MNKRTLGLVATGAAVVFCGCPGIFFSISVFTNTLNAPTEGEPINIGIAVLTGIFSLGIAFFMVLVPIVIGWLTLREKHILPEIQEIPPTS